MRKSPTWGDEGVPFSKWNPAILMTNKSKAWILLPTFKGDNVQVKVVLVVVRNVGVDDQVQPDSEQWAPAIDSSNNFVSLHITGETFGTFGRTFSVSPRTISATIYPPIYPVTGTQPTGRSRMSTTAHCHNVCFEKIWKI